MVTDEKMYHEFRNEIDSYCFPLLQKWAKQTGCYRYIMYEGEVVGFLMVIDKYIEGIYVEPEYRRKGLARQAILDYIKDGNNVEKLHIVRSNNTAYKFWNSIFELHEINSNICDVLYYIARVKERKDD
jgi:predicted acetyltransferase